MKNDDRFNNIIFIILAILLSLFFFFLCNQPAHAGIYGRLEGGKDVDTDDIYYTAINIGYKFSVFGIQSRTFGGWKTFQEMNAPFSETYTIGQSLQFQGFYMQIDHYCNHRVTSKTQEENRVLYDRYKSNPQRMTIIKIGYEWEME